MPRQPIWPRPEYPLMIPTDIEGVLAWLPEAIAEGCERALEAAGIAKVEGFFLDRDAKEVTLWVAADLGLVRCWPQVDDGAASEHPIASLSVTPWSDVEDASYDITVLL